MLSSIYKKLTAVAVLIFSAAAIAGCDSDIDPVYVQPSDPTQLSSATGTIVLSPDNSQSLVLTLYWTNDGYLTLDNPKLQAPINAAELTIQFSTDENFTSTIDIALDKGQLERQFLGDELNSLLGRLGLEPDQPTSVWVRIKKELAANITPEYSNVLNITVTTYRISLVLGAYLDKNKVDTGLSLASPTENGIYTGFFGIAGWTNWWLYLPNGITWGNLGEDGKSFYASSDSSAWNFWYPGSSGCYYTTVNTNEAWWSALYIDSMSVSGDITGDLTYNQRTNQWTLPLSYAEAGTATITLTGHGNLYDRTTTDMGPAIEKTVGFSGVASDLVFGDTPSAVTIDVPAGESTLVLDLTNPLQYVVKAGDAADTPEETPKYLYFSGLVTWDGFSDYLTLYDETTKSYGGAHYINSEWGYRAYPSEDWSVAYRSGDNSTALSGTLMLATSDGNIPAPTAGLYVMNFSIGNLTYSLTAVNTVTFAGLNNDWSETVMTQSADNPEVFTAEFTKTAETPWGVKVLINNSWSLFFGGGSEEGTLYLSTSDSGSGFTGDNNLEIGQTYVLTVDLGKQTYTYTLKQ